MGFETQKLQPKESLKPDLKYPYGIWNIYWYYEIVPNYPIWSIPMGFETLESPLYLVEVLNLKYPYGIWNKNNTV